MSFKFAEMTQETATVTGITTHYTLAGAVPGYRTFFQELVNNDTTVYVAFTTSPAQFVSYYSTFLTGPNRLSRGTVIRSSSSDADISWGANTVVNIVGGLPGKLLASLLDSAQLPGLVELTAAGIFDTTTIGTIGRALLASTSTTEARSIIAAVIGVDVQAWSTHLDAVAAGAKTAGNVIRGTGTTWASSVLSGADVSHTPVAPIVGVTVEAALDEVGTTLAQTFYKGSASGDLVMTAAPVVYAHGLLVEPKLVIVKIRCAVAEGGYSINDMYYIGSSIGFGDETGFTGDYELLGVSLDATNIRVGWFMFNHPGIVIVDKAGTARFYISHANWRMRISAYA